MGQFLRSQPEVDNYVGGADERSRQRELEARRVVLVQHGEVIARAEARGTQRARRAADPVVELRPGPGIPASWSYIGACSRGKAKAQVALGNTQLRVYHKLLSNPGTRYHDSARTTTNVRPPPAARSPTASARSKPSAS